MSEQRQRRRWGAAVRALVVSVGMLMAGEVWAPEVQADPAGDAFVSALNNAGVNYGDPGSAVALGQSICPLLAQPGGSFAGAASSIANNGIPPNMAALLTSIAISMYCPSMMASFANGNWLDGGNGVPALPFQIPGLPGQ
jgi:hypothetical protein